MNMIKPKENAQSSLEDQMKEQAKRHEISLIDLKKLYEGKKCPKYGIKEILHVRKTRGGKLTVFNISEKFRGEKISVGRKKLSNQTNQKNMSLEASEAKKS